MLLVYEATGLDTEGKKRKMLVDWLMCMEVLEVMRMRDGEDEEGPRRADFVL